MEYIIKIKKPLKHLFNDKWIWRMAWQDGRKNFGRLFLFLSSIIVGIASLVSIDSFNRNLQNEIDIQAKELLGADLVISAKKEFDSAFLAKVDTLGLKKALDVRFASMILFMNVHGGTRLVQVVAREGEFPFYGEVKTLPKDAMAYLNRGKYAVLDESVAIQYEVSSGDSIKLGNSVFEVSGIVQSMPGTTAISTNFTPSVYINKEHLEETGLIQYGSRYNYRRYFELKNSEDPALIVKKLKPETKKLGYGTNTVEKQKENLGESFQNMYKFFNLLGFIALLLGCIGVASSIQIYIEQKKTTVAVLRCLGASGWQTFNIYFIQCTSMGLIGSILGTALGLLIQFLIPQLFSSVLPVSVSFSISWISIVQGLVVGLIVSILFSAMPLTLVRKMPPLIVLRSFMEQLRKRSKARIASVVIAVVFPWLFAIYQTESLENGSVFMLILVGALLVLFLVGQLGIWLARKLLPKKAGFVWKQGLSNLFRPNNQTLALVVVIGLGSFLVGMLGQIQYNLLNQVAFLGGDDRPNTVLFDIQGSQKEDVEKLIKRHEMPIKQMVPIVTTRLDAVKGRKVNDLLQDTSVHIGSWALTREYRVTYRDSLINSESIVKGELKPYSESDSIWVSISENMAENLEVEIGDEVVFNVQGVPMTTYIGSFREVDWQRIQTNFIFVFPAGVLEAAPQFYVAMTRADLQSQVAAFQRELVFEYPNISVIDLTLILQTIDGLMDKVAFVIKFMAGFSIITGLIVLIAAISNSRYVRLKENVLLRTLGSIKSQIVKLTIVEYSFLGLLAGVTGAILAIVASWILALTFFDITYRIHWASLGLVTLGVMLIIVFIGWFNSRKVFGDTPIDILRREG